MTEWLAALEQWQAAQFFRTARWEYAALNAGHILGIALLVGGILPFDLRLLGLWRSIDLRLLAGVLIPTATAGLVIALITGALLFSVRAREYAGLGVFQLKMALIVAGAGSALFWHGRYGARLERLESRALQFVAGVTSMVVWTATLICGRLIAFAG